MAKVTIGVRVDPEAAARVDRLAAVMTEAASAELTRGDAARAALLLGLEALERKHGLAPAGAEKKGAKPANKPNK